MRDEYERRTLARMEIEHEFDNVGARRLVEIAGRLIGQQDFRIADDGAGQRHALLLAARKLAGIMRQAMAETDMLQLFFRPRKSIGPSGKFKRDGDILQRRHGGHEMEGLKDDADMLPTKAGKTILVEAGEILARHMHAARAWLLQPRQHHEKRGLARTRRTDEARRCATRDPQINSTQYVDRSGLTGQAELDLLKFNHDIAQACSPFPGPQAVPGPKAVIQSKPFGPYGIFPLIYKKLTARFLLALALMGFAAASQARAETNKPFVIVGFGDSLMAGYLLGPDEGFVPQLQKALHDKGFDNVVVRNAGVSGDTTSGGLSRLDWSIGAETDAVILELGANDALRGIDPEITRDNLEKMIETLQKRHIAILLAGMLSPPNMGSDYAGRFNTIYPDLAKKYSLSLYPFFLDGVTTHDNLTLADGMHPNPQGVAVMVKGILPKVEALIAKTQASAARP